MADFRSDPMPSSEGMGRARHAWEAYARGANKVLRPVVDPLLGPAIKSYSANTVADLFGFWLIWHLQGGYAGLREAGMSRASIYRKVSMFRKIVGVHPDEFELPGVSIDLEAYLGGIDSLREQQRRARESKTQTT